MLGDAIQVGGEASPILEPAEHDLDFVALTIEMLIMADRVGMTRAILDAPWICNGFVPSLESISLIQGSRRDDKAWGRV